MLRNKLTGMEVTEKAFERAHPNVAFAKPIKEKTFNKLGYETIVEQAKPDFDSEYETLIEYPLEEIDGKPVKRFKVKAKGNKKAVLAKRKADKALSDESALLDTIRNYVEKSFPYAQRLMLLEMRSSLTSAQKGNHTRISNWVAEVYTDFFTALASGTPEINLTKYDDTKPQFTITELFK